MIQTQVAEPGAQAAGLIIILIPNPACVKFRVISHLFKLSSLEVVLVQNHLFTHPFTPLQSVVDGLIVPLLILDCLGLYNKIIGIICSGL